MHNVGDDISSAIDSMQKELAHAQLWDNIHRAAAANPSLQLAIDHVIIIYKLTEDYERRYGSSKT